jgi:arylsulfatase A-like enzyme
MSINFFKYDTLQYIRLNKMLNKFSNLMLHMAIPSGILLIDLAWRGTVIFRFTIWEIWIYALSVLLSCLLYRAVENILHFLRDIKWLFFTVLFIICFTWTLSLAISYSYYENNGGLPNLFTFAFLNMESKNTFIMIKDSFRWFHALALAAGTASMGWLFWKAANLPHQTWRFPVLRRTLHVLAVSSLLFLCGIFAGSHEQCFLPDVNLVSMGGRFIWQSSYGKQKPSYLMPLRTPVLVPGPFKTPKYNILLILNESLRRQNLQIYGYGRETTPELMRFAGTNPGKFFLFRNAFANSTGTRLALPSILTGISPFAPMIHRKDAPLFWQWGQASGMSTFYITSHDLAWCHFRDYFSRPSPDLLWDKEASGLPAIRDMGIDDNATVARSIEEIKRLSREKRRFAGVIHLNTNHYPYNVTSRYKLWGAGELDLYDGSILEMDEQAGRILATLRELGRLEDTVVIFTSDHGEGFKEHGYIAHFFSHYIETVAVPLWIYMPPGSLSVRDASILLANIEKPVQNADIMPTVLDLMSLSGKSSISELERKMSGTSLLRSIPERDIMVTNSDEVFPTTVGLSLIRGLNHYVLRTSLRPAREELFNLAQDPWELNDLWPKITQEERMSYRRPFLATPHSAQEIRQALPELRGE